jgi:hypothetical protein
MLPETGSRPDLVTEVKFVYRGTPYGRMRVKGTISGMARRTLGINKKVIPYPPLVTKNG